MLSLKRVVLPLVGSSFLPGKAKETIEEIEDQELAQIAWAEYYFFSAKAKECVEIVEKALYQIDWNKSKQEQAIVDSYADTINKAIEGLTKKNKDYKVTEGETFVKESGKDISIRIDHEYTENVKEMIKKLIKYIIK